MKTPKCVEISLNGERFYWYYPDISYAQIVYLLTNEWKEITGKKPTITYTHKYDKGCQMGTLYPGGVVKVLEYGRLHFNIL